MARSHTGYLFKIGENYYLRWIIKGKIFKQVLKDDKGCSITTRREAEEAQGKVMASFVTGDETEALQSIAAKLEGRKAELAKMEKDQKTVLLIEGAWPEFIKSPNRPDSGEETIYQYQCQWNAFAAWVKSNHPGSAMIDVTKQMASDYAGFLSGEGRSPNTYNKHLNLLTLVFRVLTDKAGLSINPWSLIQRKRLKTHSRRELTLEELRKISQSAEGELKLLFHIGIYCGLRLGDCATLRWSEVDLKSGIIRRIPNKTARSKPDKCVQIPIHPALRSMLDELPEARGEFVMPKIGAFYGDRTDLVTDMVQRHFVKCGIKLHKTGTGGDTEKRAVIEVGFHSLRHTFVSLCRASDVPLSVVESLVGHSNPAMTRYYTHTGDLAASKAVSSLPLMTGERAPLVDNAQSVIREVISIANGMTEENWKTKRDQLVKVAKDSNLL